MEWFNVDLYLSIRVLLITNPAFLFSFVIYLRVWEIFGLNQKKTMRYVEIYVLLLICLIYCFSYQALTIRWCVLHFDNAIPKFDTIAWSSLEFMTQIIHFLFLSVFKGIMSAYLSKNHEVERSDDVSNDK